TDGRGRKRDKGMTGLYESRIGRPARGASSRLSGGGDNALKLIANLLPDGAIDRRMGAVGLAHHHGIAGVRGGPDRHVQRNLAEEGHAEPLGLVAGPAMAENVAPLAAM